jgi:hypothetical protein
VSVGKETSRILLNLAHVEAISSVLSISQNTRLERTRNTSNTTSNPISNVLRVGKGDSRGSRSSLCGLVDVCGSKGRRTVVAAESVQFNVVADEVHVRVDAELEESGCALQAAGGCCAVDDFAGHGLDFVVAGELEGRADSVGSCGAVCSRSGSGSRSSTTLGVVDRGPATGRRRVLAEVGTGSLGVVDGLPSTWIFVLVW